MQTDKKAIRKEILKKRELLSEQERREASEVLKTMICDHPWYIQADILLGFVGYGSEIYTEGILQEALACGKKVFVPKVEGDDLVFYRIPALSDLKEGYKGIKEPCGDTECFVYAPQEASHILMLMPGVVFDKKGNRCGYGKGFYDRYLTGKDALQQRTIGVGFRCQVIEELPVNEWDIRPCQILCI